MRWNAVPGANTYGSRAIIAAITHPLWLSLFFPTALELAANATRPEDPDRSYEKERVKSYTEESASDIRLH